MTTKRSGPRGATVYTRINARLLGDALHRLEYMPDVHVVSRHRDPLTGEHCLALRSDRFPHAWDRKDVALVGGADHKVLTIKLA